MRILILLFRQFYFVVANDCECEVEPWSQWSTAYATCGSTRKMRQRVCSIFDGWTLGLSCHNQDRWTRDEYKSVVLPACPTWGSWTGYTPCTKSCGFDGEQVRHRRCISNQTIVNETECPGSEASASQSQTCNEHACPVPIHCPYGQYIAESKTSCLICLPGNYCSEGIIRSCISGKDCSKEGQYQENDCRKGYQCSDPANPQACHPGTFNENLNAGKCDDCSIGTNCSGTGETHQRECAVGFECSNPAYPTQCLSGSLATSLNQTKCLPCPINYDCSIPTKPVFIAPSIVQGDNAAISSCSHHRLLMESNKFDSYQVVRAMSEISDQWKTGSLCRIGLFKQGESNQINYKWIWPKSSEIIERRKWSWKNPGVGDWEIRSGLSRALVSENFQFCRRSSNVEVVLYKVL